MLYALRKKINRAKMLVDDYRKGRDSFNGEMNAAFERWADVLTSLILKYGPT